VTIAGSPKKLAHDVAEGYQQYTPATLRQYSSADLKILLFNLNFVLREVRGKPASLEDMEALKEKQTKIQRLNQAINTIQAYAALKRIQL
jgi:hypothetical protein